MRRELWAIGNTFAYAIRVLNSIFCTDCKEEHEVSEDEKWLVAEQIGSMCSLMMLEDAGDILTMVNSMPDGRLCERIDCLYHHPKNPATHNYGQFKEKCFECMDNQKCKTKSDKAAISGYSHYECP